jgi:hypothetical protein
MMDLESIEEYMLEGREELKRVEHIIYVSLKYTRTTDVLRNAVLRFVSFFDIMFEGYMVQALEKELITKIPTSPALRVTRLVDMNPDDEDFRKFVVYYFFLKDLLMKDYGKINEYRRHVGMVFDLDNKSSVIINIDNLETCEYYAHKFFRFSTKFLGLSKEEE